MPAIVQSALHPAGPGAASIGSLWWLMFWTCTVIYVLVMGTLVVAVRRRRSDEGPAAERTLVRSVAGASAVTVAILFGLLVASVLTGRAVASLGSAEGLVIEITGNQWWWNVEYHNPNPSLRVRTANELHIPVGRQIRIQLASNDVIHSFWVPNLHGKRDMIPGRPAQFRLQPLRAGIYRGQCAEFCGLQHAHMALDVVVESRRDFDAWYERQLATPLPVSEARAARGQEVFMTSACNLCHAIAGTDASASFGPDLSHFASRRSIAAGTLPNDPGNLRRWLENPQRVKPGNRMPVVSLGRDDIDALVAYLGTLQ